MKVPLASRSADAFATTGSYDPNASVPADTVQFTDTVADTLRFAVAVVATTVVERMAETRSATAAPEARAASRFRSAGAKVLP